MSQKTLVKNVSIFDGIADGLITGKDLVLEDNLISKFVPAGGDESTYDTVIDGQGKFLMPGLIDAHTHLALVRPPFEIESMRTLDYVGALTAVEAERYLMRGFTTVRDVAGPTLSLKLLIDDGLAKGPRIFSSGAGLSQTAGHGDMRLFNERAMYYSGDRFRMADYGFFYLADGVDEVRKACRDALAKQVAQIKMCTGGGVTSLTDPLDSIQYTLEEIKAAVDEATRYGTYVCAHLHTDPGCKMALDGGVKSLEHASLIEEDTVKQLVDQDAWVCPQSFITSQPVEGNPTFTDPIQKAKFARAKKGTLKAFEYFKKYEAKVAFGTDMFGSREAFDNTNKEFVTRTEYYSSVEVLQQATSACGELLALSNLKHPYPGAKLGVVEAGAYADLLIIDGNPIEDIKVMLDYENNFKLIMKDGKVYKNTL
jgi:imidazolonepropionase-like amidohydrolase